MVELSEHKCNLKEDEADYQSYREGGFATHDEYAIREVGDFETAASEDDLKEWEHPEDPEDKYEPTIKDFDFRADKCFGSVQMEPSEKNKPPRKASRRKSNKGNPIAGLIIIILIITLVKSCSGI